MAAWTGICVAPKPLPGFVSLPAPSHGHTVICHSRMIIPHQSPFCSQRHHILSCLKAFARAVPPPWSILLFTPFTLYASQGDCPPPGQKLKLCSNPNGVGCSLRTKQGFRFRGRALSFGTENSLSQQLCSEPSGAELGPGEAQEIHMC